MRERGFTYLAILFAIAMMSTVMGVSLEVWHTAQVREKERELLFVGAQFRLAIGRYYLATPGRDKQYPPSLDDLLEDPRLPGVQRYLRRIYRDPVTGLAEWGIVRGARGEVVGVHSLSEAKPVKAANFAPEEADFADAKQYADWLFVYRPGPLPAGRAGQADSTGRVG